jgi:hypothetical protein
MGVNGTEQNRPEPAFAPFQATLRQINVINRR